MAAVLLLTIPIAADDFMLAPPEHVPAEGFQLDADVASNGSETLVVWRDNRGSTYDVFATRLRDDGTALDPLGILIAADAYSPFVVAAGDDFVVAYGQGGGAWLTRIEEGRVGTAVSLGSGTPIDLASDGRSFCVLLREETSVTALFVDPAGNFEAAISLHSGAQQVVAMDDAYWVVIVNKSGAVSVTQLTARGIRRTRRLNMSGQSATIAAAGDRMFVAAVGARYLLTITADYVILDAEGKALTPFGYLEEKRPFTHEEFARAAAAWDGNEFLLAWRDIDWAGRSTFRALRVSADGKAMPAGFPSSTRSFATTRHKSAMVMVTSDPVGDGLDLFARVAPSFAAAAEAPATLIAWSAISQETPKTAAVGGVTATVWRQGRFPNGVSLALVKPDRRSRLIEVTPPADGTRKLATLASSRDQFLAVWSATRASYDEVRIFARRITADGTVRDPVPIELRPGGNSPVYDITPAVASDGSSFLVAWEDNRFPERGFYAAFLRENGKYVPPVLISSTSGEWPIRRMPVRAIWTGSLYAVTWIEGNDVRMARVTADGVPLDRESVLIAREPVAPAGLDAASDGNGHAMVVWASSDCLRAVALTAEGVLTSPHALLCGPATQRASVAAAWNGSGFTIYRAQGDFGRGTVLESLNVSESLAPHGSARVLVGEGAGVFAPSATALPNGIFLVYERIADGEAGGVRRVFARAAPRRGR